MNQSSRSIPRFQCRLLGILLLFLISICLPPEALARKRRSSQVHPTIRDIIITPKDIFDPNLPGEDKWPYRAANFLHITTREKVVRRELLMRPGDRADPERLEESERLLRALPFIKDARIRTVPVENGQVDLLVETQDSWTTQPQVDYGSEGGQHKLSMGFSEENLLGYGKTAEFFYKEQSEGVSHQYAYKDPQLFGSRVILDSTYDDTPTGNRQKLTVQRPFYSLTTRVAAGSFWSHSDERQKLVENGVETNSYRQDRHDVDVFAGRLLNHDALSVHRLSLRYIYTTDFFSAEPATDLSNLPKNKTFSGPAVQWNWVESEFIKETFADRAERVEDINLGHQAQVRIGHAAHMFGSTENSLSSGAGHSFGFGREGDQFVLTSYGITGRYNTYATHQESGKLRNTIYFLNANYYKHLPTEFPCTGVAHFETAYAQNIDNENQLEMGGDTGLRGYKALAFTGNKSMLMNLEGRAFYPHEVLHLAYLGGAAFVDAGQTRPQGLGYDTRYFRASVGMGLRIALTRSSGGAVYRFDVAYALGPTQGEKRIVFAIASGQGFSRNANTYKKFPGIVVASD